MQKINYKEFSPEKKEQVETFVKFLKSKRLNSAYMRNLANELEGGTVEEFFNSYKGCRLLSSAFAWDRTPEGHKVWSRLFDDLERLLDGK